MLSSELKQQIESLWDKFWSNGMSDHMAALKHINYLVFMKYLEDFENVKRMLDKSKKRTSRKLKDKGSYSIGDLERNIFFLFKIDDISSILRLDCISKACIIRNSSSSKSLSFTLLLSDFDITVSPSSNKILGIEALITSPIEHI